MSYETETEDLIDRIFTRPEGPRTEYRVGLFLYHTLFDLHAHFIRLVTWVFSHAGLLPPWIITRYWNSQTRPVTAQDFRVARNISRTQFGEASKEEIRRWRRTLGRLAGLRRYDGATRALLAAKVRKMAREALSGG